ncbi:MAG: hypothetical protein JWM95_3035 [Gemmatimonadetes bacterium]|nr:hypothetical protein [Gemmatimonadota bacterium]
MTKPKDDRGRVQGAQEHAEGQHGDKTRSRIMEQLNQSAPDESDNIIASHRDGQHRLSENREQHDEAEQNSERNRQDRS